MSNKPFIFNPSAACVYLVNATISILALILCSPLVILICLAIKCQDGGSIFYSGERYGYKKKKFTIYKFRTLVPNAEEIIGARLLQPGEGLETRLGKFLRETRLDELPQLFNIINGTMTFIGPRPERPVIYEKVCKEIKGYDKRFDVKPGVFGYSQLFTPHTTDKRMRAYIDNYYSQRNDYITEIKLVIYSFFIIGIALHGKAFKLIFNKCRMFFYVRRINSLRRFQRHTFNNSKSVSAEIWLAVNEGVNKIDTRMGLGHSDLKVNVENMNDMAILILANRPISFSHIDGTQIIRISICKTNALGLNKKNKIIYCRLIECTQERDGYRYLLTYKSISPLNQYKVNKYLLNRSVA